MINLDVFLCFSGVLWYFFFAVPTLNVFCSFTLPHEAFHEVAPPDHTGGGRRLYLFSSADWAEHDEIC